MRQLFPTLIILVVCAVVLGLYYFAGRPQLLKQITELRAQNETLAGEVARLEAMRKEIPELIKQLPEWKRQLDLFRTAIPANIEDQVFLSKLADQMQQRGVKLISVELAPGGPWLGNVNDDERDRLKGIGVDVEKAMAVKTADYTIKLNGEFKDIVQAFENLKAYKRLYTLNEFAGPAVGAGGAVSATVDQSHTPIMVAGSLYYGLPQGGMSDEELDQVIGQIMLSPFTQRLQKGVSKTGQGLLDKGHNPADRHGEDNSKPNNSPKGASTT